MSENNLKTHYSAKELLSFSLSAFPNSVQGIIYQAKKQQWNSQKKSGKGGGLEYALSSMPEHIQTEIRKKCGLAVIAQKPKLDLVAIRQELDLRTVTDKQIAIADARMGIAQHFLAMEAATGMSRNKLKHILSDEIKAGTAPQQILDWVVVANAKRQGKQTVSPRTLYDWALGYEKSQSAEERIKSLVPLKKKESVRPETELWLADFLALYQTFSKPSVSYVYKTLKKQQMQGLPDISKVRRVLAKLPKIELERGRRTGSEMKAILPFKRRDWEVLGVNEVWISDGHSFKARVKNMAGIPYVPEVTVFIDGRTRLIVGWSISQSESVLAVSDAFRHAVSQHGLPNICYSDNGRGQSNKMLDAEITGLFPRLGVHHETGTPGNPQGRGIIEGLWAGTLIDLAKTYPTYHGKDADESTKHYRYRKLESAIIALTKNKTLTDEQKKHLGQVPHFTDFVADVTACVEEYNHRPHRSLPRKADGSHYSPLEYREVVAKAEKYLPNKLAPMELELLFRPEEIRVVDRGEVVLARNIYFSTALADYHGQKVRVAFDVHDPASVIVKTLEGEWICVALLDGNKDAAFPTSVREKAKIKSVEAANKRLQAKIDRRNMELNPVITIEQKPDFTLLQTDKAVEKAPVFILQADKEAYEKKRSAG